MISSTPAVRLRNAEVPPWNDKQKEAWDRAREWHVRLCKAAKIKPVMKLRLTDVDQGVMNIRWIERNARVPDGPDVGKPFRLRQFQRDVITGIYSDDAYRQAVDAVLKKRAS